MTLEERSNLVLALARVLYVNGQPTETLAAAERFGHALGLRAKIMGAGQSCNLRRKTATPE